MSCITEILKLKGESEFLRIPGVDGIVVEGGGTFKGYEYLITFVSNGHRCGYVAISADHPCYSVGENSYSDPVGYSFYVHGGITFNGRSDIVDSFLDISCDDRWLGFDAYHYNDAPCLQTSLKYFGECHRNKAMRESEDDFKISGTIHRTYEYMEEECKDLIDQLSEIKK